MFSLCFMASYNTYNICALVSQNLRYIVNISLNRVANTYYKCQTKMAGEGSGVGGGTIFTRRLWLQLNK